MFTQSLLLFPLVFALFDSASAATLTTPPPFPTANANGTCPTKKCGFDYPVGSMLDWYSFIPSTTIIAATVSVHIINGTNQSTTTTIYNELPIGIELPPTNSAGTRTTVVTSFGGGTVEVAYPTMWADYDSLVSWSGTLSTKGICSTETGAVITLPPHPPIPSSLLPGKVTTDPNDPRGIVYSPKLEEYFHTNLAEEMPNEGVLKSCALSFPLPLIAVSGVHFLTETTTDYGSGPATTTAEPAQVSSNSPAPLPPVSVVQPAQSSAAPGKPEASSSLAPGKVETLAPTLAPVITVGNSPITATGSFAFAIGTQTLNPGDTITISGTTIALEPSASFIVVNGDTSTVARATVTPPPALTVGDTALTGNQGDSASIVSGQTLTLGGTIALDGTTLALGPSPSLIVVNGATSTLSNSVALVTPPPLTVGGNVYTTALGAGTSYIVSGKTLTPGGAITVNGTVISLPASGVPTIVVITDKTSSAFFSIGGKETSPAATKTLEASQTSIGKPLFTGSAGEGARLQRWDVGGIVLTLGVVFIMFI